jgi:hypothetical protein
MININDKVKCKETGLVGTVDDKEWEHGWTYTIITDEGKFFYRDHCLLIKLNLH